jgi:hypothetical protein
VARGRSAWAPRLAIISTISLIICLIVPEALRPVFAFGWVCLALAAMVLEFAARRRSR